MKRSSASPHKSAAAALPWVISDFPSAPQGLRPLVWWPLGADRQDPTISHPHPSPTRWESNPQALRREAGHKIRQTGKGKRLPLSKCLGPIPQIFVQIPNNWDLFERTFCERPQSILQPDCRISISHPRPTITAWCSSICTSDIKPPDLMDLLNQTSHCFHMHRKYLSDLFDREADVPRRLFSIYSIDIWESYYRFAWCCMRLALFHIGMGEQHTLLPLGVCQDDIHRTTDRSYHKGHTLDCIQSLVR